MTAHPLSLHPVACPLCGDQGVPELLSEGNVDARALGSFAFASRKVPEFMHHRLVRCRRCDVVYADAAPSPELLAEAYVAADFDSGVEARHASRTYAAVVDSISTRLPSRDGVLDIGTGDGSLLDELLRRGFTNVRGVEPSAAPIAQATETVRPLIHRGVFTRGLAEPGSLSLVTCLQTIEHVPAPLDVCREAARLLRPGGALLLVAHNRRALSARMMGDRSPIFDIEHLQLFSPESARIMLERAGLVDITVRPLVNRYPVRYWARLLPLPARIKAALTRLLAGSRVGLVTVPLRAGNMTIIGFRATHRSEARGVPQAAGDGTSERAGPAQ